MYECYPFCPYFLGPILGPEDHVAPFLSNNRGFCLSDLSRANSESPSQSGADLASRAIYVNRKFFNNSYIYDLESLTRFMHSSYRFRGCYIP
jgi:hypothetical protein